jgi:hypothetical protein
MEWEKGMEENIWDIPENATITPGTNGESMLEGMVITFWESR